MYSCLSPLDRTIAFGTMIGTFVSELESSRGVVIPALIVEAPLSRMRTGMCFLGSTCVVVVLERFGQERGGFISAFIGI